MEECDAPVRERIAAAAGQGCTAPELPRAANWASGSQIGGRFSHSKLQRVSTVPFKANADRRHHIPKQQHRVTNWPEYDAALRQRGSLTVWFTEAAIAA